MSGKLISLLILAKLNVAQQCSGSLVYSSYSEECEESMESSCTDAETYDSDTNECVLTMEGVEIRRAADGSERFVDVVPIDSNNIDPTSNPFVVIPDINATSVNGTNGTSICGNGYYYNYTCICDDGWETSPGQDPSTKQFCNVQVFNDDYYGTTTITESYFMGTTMFIILLALSLVITILGNKIILLICGGNTQKQLNSPLPGQAPMLSPQHQPQNVNYNIVTGPPQIPYTY